MLRLHVTEVITDNVELRVYLSVYLPHLVEGLLLLQGHLRLLVKRPHIVLQGFETSELCIKVLGLLLTSEKLSCDERSDFF